MGKNGSGKSTLAKNLNGLLLPTERGHIRQRVSTPPDDEHIWDVRQSAGMVFQNPDNQLVSAIVEDDVAFGPENLGVEPAGDTPQGGQGSGQMSTWVHIQGKGRRILLSGGQKQRSGHSGRRGHEAKLVSSSTSRRPCWIPKGRGEIMAIISELHGEGITVILITHFMEEAVDADRVIIMHDGRGLSGRDAVRRYLRGGTESSL